MDLVKKSSFSDDEEDLELLRLAALQTLKKNAAPVIPSFSNKISPSGDPERRYLGQNRRIHYNSKKGRFFNNRGGQFHSRKISSNLISLTPSITEQQELDDSYSGKINDVTSPPQKLYNTIINKTQSDNNKKTDGTTKFDRYKDSDNSEDEDSEEELLKSESEDDLPNKLSRSGSLEALMKELDDEIQGRSKAEEKLSLNNAKGKINKIKKRNDDDDDDDNDNDVKKVINDESDENVIVIKVEEKENVNKSEIVAEIQQNNEDKNYLDKKEIINNEIDKNGDQNIINKILEQDKLPKRKKIFTTTTMARGRGGFSNNYNRGGRNRNFKPQPQSAPHPFYTANNSTPFSSIIPPQIYTNFPPPNLPSSSSSSSSIPNYYDRPLMIDTESLQTQTMAPLSPRSAAFVLENRAIIEKRKRSPLLRRSYSRSPSPRHRSKSPGLRNRSLTPRKRSFSPRKRSLSPPSPPPSRRRSISPLLRSRRSISPLERKWSPTLRKRSRSPPPPPITTTTISKRSTSPPSKQRRNNCSPNNNYNNSPSRRRSLSPKRRDKKDNENFAKNKLSVRERLGIRSSPPLLRVQQEESNKEKSNNNDNNDEPKHEKVLDPVLEARKRKFESKEIKIREGVIRLKPKFDATVELEESKEMIKCETDKVNKLEISAEAEAEFLEDDELDLEAQVDLFSDEELYNENEENFKIINNKELKTSRNNVCNKKEVPREPRNERKKKSLMETKPKHRKSTTVSSSKAEKNNVKEKDAEKHMSRKVEIKSSNKREKLPQSEENDIEEIIIKKQRTRKVELGVVKEADPEIIIEHDETETAEGNKNSNEGDLRAQLSKKRAEKLQKNVSHEEISSRLLQNALQNALPLKNKEKKVKSNKELISNNDSNKVPIHLRLGIACGSSTSTSSSLDPFNNKSKNKKSSSKKRKSNESSENNKVYDRLSNQQDDNTEEIL